MTYSEAIQYLYSKLPMFTRIGSKAFKANLNNTLAFCAHLGNPENRFKSVHIAGTNGKGSTSHMLAAILQAAGYKTGLYTSPHLRDFRERIRINGVMIAQEQVISFIDTHQEFIDILKPSFFETTAAMAFDHFAEQQVDIAVIEVGLGGRLDSTNVIQPLLSVITNIGLDHTDILGDTLPQIAAEKAGIIKPSVPVVIGETHTETAEVFTQKASEHLSAITFADQNYHIESLSAQNANNLLIRYQHKYAPQANVLELDLSGSYQKKNVATVLTAVDELRKQDFNISVKTTLSALKQVSTLTGLQGRWQTLSKQPLTICDTGHNAHGIKEVIKNIRATKHHQLHMVIGMVKDKDSAAILTLLPKEAYYYFCQPDLPRAKLADDLKKEALALGLKGNSFNSVAQALEAAKIAADAEDLIFVGGSTFVVAEVI